MRALLTTYGSRGDVEPMGGLAAESVAAQFDAVAAAAEECDVPVAAGVMSTGGWR